MISIQTDLSKKVEPCDRETFMSVIASQTVRDVCAQVAGLAAELQTEKQKAEPDKARCKALHDEMSKRKKNLPAFLFMASFPGGRRKQEDARLTGLYMADFDNVLSEELRVKSEEFGTSPFSLSELFNSSLFPLPSSVKEHVVLVHITPSGRGLRIVAKADPAIGNLADNQQWLADKLGLPLDKACKDASRMSFAFPEDNLLFLSDELFTYDNPEYEEQYGESYRAGKSGKTAGSTQNFQLSQNPQSSQLSSLAFFRGVPYTLIIDEWWRQQGGVPVEGERNQKLHKLAANLRYICDNNADRLLSVMPSLGLSGQEMRSIAASACKSPVYLAMPKALRAVLKAVGLNDEKGETAIDGDAARIQLEKQFARFPLPPAMQAVVSGVDKQLRVGAMLASLPMFYTLLTRISFDHFDGTSTRLSGMTIIVGPPAAGKSFIADLKQLLLAPIIESDKVGRVAEEKYRTEKEQCKNKDRQPCQPHFPIRILPIQTSNTILARRMRDAVDTQDENLHLHCITIETELATAIRAAKGGSWIEKNDILCKGFHNELWGMDYASDQATNGEVEVNYNLVVSGTDDAFNKFIPTQTILSGLPTRLMYYQMPPSDFKMIEKRKLRRTGEEEQLIIDTAHRLDRLRGKVDAGKLTDAMFSWCKGMAMKALLEDDHELDDLRKRTALIGERAGIVYAILSQLDRLENGLPLTFDKNALRFARFVADYTLYMQYSTFASRMREQKARVAEYKGVTTKMAQLTDIYNRLPQTFTVADLQNLRPEATRNALDLNCHKWQRRGFIKRTGDGRYEKIIKKV